MEEAREHQETAPGRWLALANLALLAFQLLCFLASLAVIGEHLRRLLARKLAFLRGLDPFLAFVLDLYLGELALYALALIPGAFRPEVLIAITVLAWLGLLACLMRRPALPVEPPSGEALKRELWEVLVALSLSAYVLAITISPFAELYVGDLSDIWLHGLYARLIMERRCLPRDMAPYGQAPIFYPLGFHVMAVYAAYLFSWNPLLAVAYACCAFRALAPLAAYALGRSVDREGRLGLAMALAFGLISRWPRLTPYGAGPFISGSSLFFIIIAFLASGGAKIDLREPGTAAFLGLLCGLLFVTYPMLALTAMPLLAYCLLKSCWPRKELLAKSVLASSTVCLSVMAYTIGQYLAAGDISTYTPFPGAQPDHELLVKRTYQSLEGMMIILDRFFWGYWLSPDAFVRSTIFMLMSVATMLAPIFHAHPGCARVRRLLELALLGALLNAIMPLPCLDEVGLVPLGAVSFEYFFLIFYYHMLFLTAILIYVASRVERTGLRPLRDLRLSAEPTAVGLLLVGLIIWPFFYYSAMSDWPFYVGHHERLNILGPGELEAIQWIRDNLPEDALILIDYWEAGRAIPALAGRRVIPVGRAVFSRVFNELLEEVAEGLIDPGFYEVVRAFGITHVFVGGRAFPGRPDWEAWVFWGNPNFKLLFRSGTACVFAITGSNANWVAWEEFEDHYFYSRGWVRHVSGLGEFEENYNYTYAPGQMGLLLTARATAGTYEVKLIRKLVLWNTSRIYLSIFINMTGLGAGGRLRLYLMSEDGRWIALCRQGDELLDLWPSLAYPLLNGTGYYRLELARLWRLSYGELPPSSLRLVITLQARPGAPCSIVLDHFSICLGS